MHKTEMELKVTNILRDHLGLSDDEPIRRESVLGGDDALYVDSLDVVELAMAIEEEFGCEIPDDDADKIKTVGDIVDYLANKEAVRK